MRHEWIAIRENALLLIIDIQQSMVKVMTRAEEVNSRVNQLCRAAEELEVPIRSISAPAWSRDSRRSFTRTAALKS